MWLVDTWLCEYLSNKIIDNETNINKKINSDNFYWNCRCRISCLSSLKKYVPLHFWSNLWVYVCIFVTFFLILAEKTCLRKRNLYAKFFRRKVKMTKIKIKGSLLKDRQHFHFLQVYSRILLFISLSECREI